MSQLLAKQSVALSLAVTQCLGRQIKRIPYAYFSAGMTCQEGAHQTINKDAVESYAYHPNERDVFIKFYCSHISLNRQSKNDVKSLLNTQTSKFIFLLLTH